MKLKKFFYILSGDDCNIIYQCSRGLKNGFAIIGFFVLIIFALCFLSSFFTFTKIFHNLILGIFVSIFFSWMITNIYLLLLYTLTKNGLPHIKKKGARIFSVGIRIGFICFIAILVSKPFETLLFSSQLAQEISIYKQEQIQKYTVLTNEYFEQETKQLKRIIKKQKELYGNDERGQIKNYSELLLNVENQKTVLVSKMEKLVDHSNYYIRSILILNTKYPSCWLITLLIVVIFIIPAYWKNYFIEKSNYFDLKKNIETKLITEEYLLFKNKYEIIVQTYYNTNKSFSEPYADAPFNTIRKSDSREFLSEDDLIIEIYNA